MKTEMNEEVKDKGMTSDEVVKKSFQRDENAITEKELPGVLCHGVQYYDLRRIHLISNTGLVNLVNLLRSLLQRGLEVRFINVCDAIKIRMKVMGLDKIFQCDKNTHE